MNVEEVILAEIGKEHRGVSGIYAIYNLVDGRFYIGESVNMYKRHREHVNELDRARHCNKRLQHAWDKYGRENFKFYVIELCDKRDLDCFETAYIQKLNAMKAGYNIVSCAVGFHGEEHPMYGRHHSAETKKRISKNRTGKYKGPENNFWGIDRNGKNNPMYGRHLSSESIKKMIEHRPPMNGKNNPIAKPVVMADGSANIIAHFDTIASASEYMIEIGAAKNSMGAAISNIGGALKRGGTAYGYYWFCEGARIVIPELVNPASKPVAVIDRDGSRVEMKSLLDAAEYVISRGGPRSTNARNVSIQICRIIKSGKMEAYGYKFEELV